jgi:hypothetical protein
MAEYMRRFRDTQNKCYSLTIGEKDLAEMVFAGLMSSIKDKLEGHDFSDMNQVLQHALAHENRTKELNPMADSRKRAPKTSRW